MLPNYLAKIKSSGIYRFVWDKSEMPTQDAEILRLVVGYSEKGPFNTPVYVTQPDEFKQIFGDRSKKLERYGMWFHRMALQALQAGPILALNVKNFEDSAADTNEVEYTTFNPNASIFNTDILGEIIANLKMAVKDLYNTDRFWTLEPEHLEDLENMKYITITTTDSKETSATIFMRGYEPSGFDVPIAEWYSAVLNGEEIPTYLEGHERDLVSQFFAEIYVFGGEFTPEVASSDQLAKFFDVNGDSVTLKPYILNAFGEKIDTLSALATNDASNFIGSYSGILLPEFRNASNTVISLDALVNADNYKHKLMMRLNQDMLYNIDPEDPTGFQISDIDTTGWNLGINFTGRIMSLMSVDPVIYTATWDPNEQAWVYSTTPDHTGMNADYYTYNGLSFTVDPDNEYVMEFDENSHFENTGIREGDTIILHDTTGTNDDMLTHVVNINKTDIDCWDITIQDIDGNTHTGLTTEPVITEYQNGLYLVTVGNDRYIYDQDPTPDIVHNPEMYDFTAGTGSATYTGKCKVDSDNGTDTMEMEITELQTSVSSPAMVVGDTIKINGNQNTYDSWKNGATISGTGSGIQIVHGGSPTTSYLSWTPTCTASSSWDITASDINGDTHTGLSSQPSVTSNTNPLWVVSSDSDYIYDNDPTNYVIASAISINKVYIDASLNGVTPADIAIYKCMGSVTATSNALKPLYLNGYTYGNPKPQSTRQWDKLQWQHYMLAAFTNYKGLRQALTNRVDVNYRYIVDTFEGFVEVGCKGILSTLCKEKDNAFAILNFPSMKSFSKCPYTSFRNEKGEFDTKYIALGGNSTKPMSVMFTLPSQEDGASWCGFFTAAKIRDMNTGIKNDVPSAALVSNNFMRKYTTYLPYTIIAGTNRGVLNEQGLIGPDFNFSRYDLDNLEPMGVNCLVYVDRKGTCINSNQTAKQNPVTTLSKIHVRELVIFLQDEIEKLLEDYHWDFNTPNLRNTIKDRADVILETAKNNQGVYTYYNQCDEVNNNEDVINNEMLVLSTSIEPTMGAGKMVQELTIYRYGGMRAALKLDS